MLIDSRRLFLREYESAEGLRLILKRTTIPHRKGGMSKRFDKLSIHRETYVDKIAEIIEERIGFYPVKGVEDKSGSPK